MDNGMTRNESPVYLLYPPDRSGRRPSPRTELQYASPRERAAQRDPTMVDQHRVSASRQPDRSSSCHIYNHYPSISSNHTSAAAPRPRYENTQDRRTVSGTVDYTSSESSIGEGHHRAPTQPTSAAYWYCCQRCDYPGPYLSQLHMVCLCGVRRCPSCQEETVVVRDRVILR